MKPILTNLALHHIFKSIIIFTFFFFLFWRIRLFTNTENPFEIVIVDIALIEWIFLLKLG